MKSVLIQFAGKQTGFERASGKERANPMRDEEDASHVMAGILLLLSIVPVAFLHAWTVKCLWWWFAVPTFGMTPLRLVEAFGLALLVGYFQHIAPSKSKQTAHEAWNVLFLAWFRPSFTLIFGWIVNHWM
jgi:hypothetical protein